MDSGRKTKKGCASLTFQFFIERMCLCVIWGNWNIKAKSPKSQTQPKQVACLVCLILSEGGKPCFLLHAWLVLCCFGVSWV